MTTEPEIFRCPCQHCASVIEHDGSQAGKRITCPQCGKETLTYISTTDQIRLSLRRRPQQNPDPKGFVTCRCQHCDGHIEFDGSDFADDETRQVGCPFCKMETVIFIPISPIPPIASAARIEPPPPPVIWFGSESSLLRINTVSGAQYEINGVRLFNALDLQRIANIKASAAQKMGGVSTGFGAIGSLSSVLITAGIIGAVESVLSSNAAQQGTKFYQEALSQEKRLRTQGEFFPVGMIDEIEEPAPQLWNVPRQPSYPSGFIHNGEDFIVVKNTDAEIHRIRWSSVEHYDYKANK